MNLRDLTPDNQVRLHLAKAHEYWREDRLDLAIVAMENALRVGVTPGHIYDLQRTLEAERGARQAGRFLRVEEWVILEADPGAWGDTWPRLVDDALQAFQAVTDALGVRWGKPVLVTLIPDDAWVEFMRARYGYYLQRTEVHKVCLPPSAVRPRLHRGRALRHETAHAAAHQLAGDSLPRWLNEGIAVWLEGGAALPARRPSMSLEEVSAGFESFDVDLGSPRSYLSYAAAGDFVGRLVAEHGQDALTRLLRRIGRGERFAPAFQATFGRPLRHVEREWRQSFASSGATSL